MSHPGVHHPAVTGWSDAAIPDLEGLRAVVTGGNSGIGYWTALQLGAHGAAVVLATRNPARADAAIARIRQDVPRARVEPALLDLADLTSVRAFAERESASGARLDLLVNNAGIAVPPYGRTADGFEVTFGTNHLGHFALTGLLLPRLLAAPAARVVVVASNAAQRGRIDFENLQGERHYDRWQAYGQSKLANLLFMRELARRAEVASAPLLAVAAHPGFAATGLATGVGGPPWVGRVGTAVMALAGDSPRRGALPTLYAATTAVPSGSYWGPGRQGRGPAPAALPPAALDPGLARRLWEDSERLTGVTFAF
jgi:NAD(P)-dependent dehydrogenase (short-subunit alcohol dehydrogenase family)